MPEPLELDRLETVLISVGSHLVVDDEARSGTAARGPAGSRSPRRLLVAAAVLAVVAGAAFAIAPARRAVSGWLHAGDIEVEVDPDLTVEPALPTFLDGATPLMTSELSERLGQTVPDVSGTRLGPPEAWWSPPERGVLAAWSDGDTSLWIVRYDDTFPGSLDKWVGDPDLTESLPKLGDGGYAVDGAHVADTPYRRIRAQTVVAWTDGGLTFRLDSALPRDDLIAIAEAIAES